jgi:hypothetical protein
MHSRRLFAIRRPVLFPALAFGLFASIVVLPLSARPAFAAWPHNPYIDLVVSGAANDQGAAAAVSDGAGGLIVAWHDSRSGTGYDIYAQRILASGVPDPAWPVGGRVICNDVDNQLFPVIVSDGAGGAIFAWTDYRSGFGQIYAQHVFVSGVVNAMWPVNGRAVGPVMAVQQSPTIVSDGAAGALIAWVDSRLGSNDIYAQHVLSYGALDMLWPASGQALCNAVSSQVTPRICKDGSGGAIVAWADYRSGFGDIYAQHVQAGGTVDPQWPTDGRALVTAANDQLNPVLETDGSGGALVAWEDYRGGFGDIYVTRLLSSGTLYWASNGVPLCLAANNQTSLSITSDGGAGVLLAWQDVRSGGSSTDIYAHHVVPSGPDGAWPADGLAVCTASDIQQEPAITTDGAGGAIVVWRDNRPATGTYAQRVLAGGTVDATWPVNGRAMSTPGISPQGVRAISDGAGGAIAVWSDYRSSGDVFAKRVARFGYLGTPEAEIVSVTDVPNDQGGKAKVSFKPSWLDTEFDPNLAFYEIWRSVPGSIVEAALRSGGTLSTFAALPSGEGRTFVESANAATGYWEYLGTQNAVHYIPGYAYLAPTTGDSTGAYNPLTAFMVVARNTSGSMFWLSAPVSGYSVDNVAPVAPAPFFGTFAAGSAQLHWNPNVEPDLAGYRLYRGTTPGFVPGPGNLIAAPPDTGYADPAGALYYYKLSAVDIHGNESAFATLLPAATVSVEGGAGAARLSLAMPSPNPARGRVALQWALPRATTVRLAVFDAAGRRVRSLVDGAMEAGEHSIVWDLRDDRGAPVSSGLCFVRLEAEGRVLVRRFATLR